MADSYCATQHVVDARFAALHHFALDFNIFNSLETTFCFPFRDQFSISLVELSDPRWNIWITGFGEFLKPMILEGSSYLRVSIDYSIN